MRALFALLGFVALVGLASCKTDVEVNAPYQERPTIYSILDAGAERQYVRVQKSFLTINNPNADSIAHNKDSLYYAKEALEVTLQAVNKTTGALLGTPTVLTAVDTNNKQAGLFYGPDQILYRTEPSFRLDPARLYRVKVRNKRTGVEADAVTNVLAPITRDLIVDPPATSDPFVLTVQPLLVIFKRGPRDYPNDSLARFAIDLTMTVRDSLVGGALKDTTLTWRLAPEQAAPSGSQIRVAFETSANRFAFFEFMRSSLLWRYGDTTADRTPLLKRYVLPSTLTITTANNKLASYIDATNNYSVLTQSRPYYSNVRNGIGIVGSRNVASFPILIGNGFYLTAQTNSRFRVLKFHR